VTGVSEELERVHKARQRVSREPVAGFALLKCKPATGSFFSSNGVTQLNPINRTDKAHTSIPSAPTEAWLFAQAISGNSIPDSFAEARRAREEREQLEWLAGISPRHAEELRKLEAAETEARRDRELLVWAAGISTDAEAKLRDLLREEAETQRAQQGWERYCDTHSATITEWSPDQPRQPKGTATGGQWAAKSGGGGGGGTSGSGGRVAASAQHIAPSPSDPSRWYLPSDAKGEWLGVKGESTFRLKTPVKVNGKLVHDVQRQGSDIG
jgi:hypothetical protein